MESNEKAPLLTSAQTEECQLWWNSLSDPWKCAFNETMLRRTSINCPDEHDLYAIYQCQTLRLAGPTAPYPNMSFELEDLTGLKGLQHVNLVIIVFQKLASLQALATLKQITSLFVHNNQIISLEGVEDLINLKEIYFNVNEVTSLHPLSRLTNLHTVYCNYNRIGSFEGIGLQHRANLKQFICLPNRFIPEAEIIRMERDIGIHCKKG